MLACALMLGSACLTSRNDGSVGGWPAGALLAYEMAISLSSSCSRGCDIDEGVDEEAKFGRQSRTDYTRCGLC